MPTPRLRLQTGSLYASNEDSWFTGTGGPWGYSPFTGEFGGVIGSAGLASEPFDDVVHGVASGDEVVFVIAVENTGAAVSDIRLRATMPAGFGVPAEGADVTVMDGAGVDLPFSGDLFGLAGLRIGAPLAGYDAESGRNIALVTYALRAGPSIPAPEATLLGSAILLGATSGGLSLPVDAVASTAVVTSSPTPAVVAETDPAAVARGQVIAFDIAIPVPQGTLADLRLDTLLPAGTAQLALVSATVTGVGSALQAARPRAAADGSLSFGTVVNAAGSGDAATINVRVVLRADGTASGPAAVQTVLSAAVPDRPGQRWSASVASTVGVVVPPAPAIIDSVWSAQRATTTMLLHPFGGVTFTANDRGAQAAMAVTSRDGTLGRFQPPASGSLDAAGDTFVMTGTITQLEAAARDLVFKPGAAGEEHFTLTLLDAAGGVAQDGRAMVTITPSADSGGVAEHFAPAPGSGFLTATADGQQTLAGGEQYGGPVSYLQGQYIYDGLEPVAIVAKTPNVFIKNFVGDAAVALLSGQNVVDAGKGSNFLVGGTGTDVFFLDARGAAVTWDTIIGFKPGDIVTLFGFTPANTYWWDERAGAPGFEGRTLRTDLTHAGHPTASLTFAGADRAVTDSYALTTGTIGGIDYMTIFAL